jgi:hypothetical protein
MESYVVRIYRCQAGAKRKLVGLVEAPGVTGTKEFASVEQLWEILSDTLSLPRCRVRVKRSVIKGS